MTEGKVIQFPNVGTPDREPVSFDYEACYQSLLAALRKN